MKRQRLSRFMYLIFLMSIFLLICGNSLTALTYLTKAVPSTSAIPLDLFQINIAPGPINSQEVVIGKFVVDDTAADLEFRLETYNIAEYPITDFKISQGNVSLTDGVTGGQVAVLRVRDLSATETAAPGMRIIKLSIAFTDGYIFPAPASPPAPGLSEIWVIKAKKPIAGTLHYWGFWERGTGDDAITNSVTRPKLIEYIEDGSHNPDVTNFAAFVDFPTTKDISFGGVHIDINDTLAPREMYQFINVGTQKLDIISVAPASPPGGAYIISGYPGSATDVLPLASFTGTQFKCLPTSTTNPALGPIPDANITITINSTVIPTLHINLKNNRAIRLNTALLLDLSGSMLTDIHGVGSWDENYKPTNPEDVRKIWHAREAGRLLKEVYKNLLPTGRFGLFTYPDLNGDCPSSEQVIALQAISSNQEFVDHKLNNADPERIAPRDDYYLTPMAEGIKKVYEILPKDIQDERNAVVMIGDGQHSCDSAPPKTTPADWETNLRASGIKFYTIPYGDDNASWTSQLHDIAEWTKGFSYPTNLLSVLNEGDLRKNHEKVIRDILQLETISDPDGTIISNQNKSHSVCISQDDYTLVFIVRWDAKIANALSVQLQMPNGVIVNSASAAASPADIAYFSSGSYIGYVVRGKYLAGRTGVGTWKILLTGAPSVSSGQTIHYAYSVYAQTRFKTNYSLNLPHVGDSGEFELTIGDKTHRVRAFTTTIKYETPTQSFGTYLSKMPVDPKLIFQAPDIIDGNKASLSDKKYYVVANILKKPFDPFFHTLEAQPATRKNQTKELSRELINNTYSASLAKAEIAGLYKVTVIVNGITINGDCFEREISIIRNIEINIDKDFFKNTVKFQPITLSPFSPSELTELLKKEPPKNFERQSVVFTPRDTFGNYWGPGHGNQISFELKNAEPIGPIVDNLDGSYSQVIQCDKKIMPSLIVTARGVTSSEITMTPPAIEISLHAGYSMLHGNSGTFSGFSGTLDVGYRFTENLSTEILMGAHYFLQDDSGNSYYCFNVSANGKYRYPIGIFKPFVNGGVGWYFPQAGDSVIGWNVGGGVGVDINPNWDAELAYNYHNLLNTGNNRFSTIQLGVRYGF